VYSQRVKRAVNMEKRMLVYTLGCQKSRFSDTTWKTLYMRARTIMRIF